MESEYRSQESESGILFTPKEPFAALRFGFHGKQP